MYIKDWLNYQNILYQIKQRELGNQITMEELPNVDPEKLLDLNLLQSAEIHDFSIELFSNFNPDSEEINKIKSLWLQILKMNRSEDNQEINLDYGDYEKMSELLEQIDQLSKSAKDMTLGYFLDQHSPQNILDWIHYKGIKTRIDDQESRLAKQHIIELTEAHESKHTELTKKFIKNGTTLKLDILNQFNALTPEIKDIIDIQKKQYRAIENKNLNLTISPSLETEYRKYHQDTEKQIQALESQLEHDIHQRMLDWL